LAHSSNCSLSKAQKLLDYRPRYSSMEGVCEALSGLIEHGQLRAKS